jgi:hypothetical protein
MRKWFGVVVVASALFLIDQAQGAIVQVSGGADFTGGSVFGIPRGSIFTLIGSLGLTTPAQSASGLPLPTSLNGVSVRIWGSASGSVFAECPLLLQR